MKHLLITVFSLALLALPHPAYSRDGGRERWDDFAGEIPEGAGGTWQVGLRVGAEFHVGGVGSTYFPRKTSTPAVPDAEQLFEGPDLMGFVEYTLNDYFRVGFEAGAQVAVIGESAFEEHFTAIVWGPYLRAIAFPGRASPYAVLAGQIYHGFAGGTMTGLSQSIGLTYAVGGGLELPLTPDVSVSFEGRFRQYDQGGTDPKVVEALLVTQFWLE